jgi:putative membrane protein
VSESRIHPRLEFEERAAPRLDAPPMVLPSQAPSSPGPHTLTLLASGVSVLVLGFALLQTGNFVAEQFARAAWLGWLTLGVAAGGFGLVGAGIWRELRGLFALHGVDTLRGDLADPSRVHAAALRWVATLPEGETMRGAIAACNDPDAVIALLRAGPLDTMRGRADALGRAAATQVFALTAIAPSAAYDALVIAWRGTRLVREVAQLYGMKPGFFGTLSLLRRVAYAATSVVATDMAVDTATRAVLTNPLLHHVIGDVAAASVGARRMIVLARATAAACSPVAPV